MDIFSVVGGNEQIVQGLLKEIDAEIRLNSNVRAVTPLSDGCYSACKIDPHMRGIGVEN